MLSRMRRLSCWMPGLHTPELSKGPASRRKARPWTASLGDTTLMAWHPKSLASTRPVRHHILRDWSQPWEGNQRSLEGITKAQM